MSKIRFQTKSQNKTQEKTQADQGKKYHPEQQYEAQKREERVLPRSRRVCFRITKTLNTG